MTSTDLTSADLMSADLMSADLTSADATRSRQRRPTPSADEAEAAASRARDSVAAPTLSQVARDFLSRLSPKVIALTWLAASAYRLALGELGLWDLAIFAGVLALWPFQEWLIHVYVLHFKPRKLGPWTLNPYVADKHRRHHADPWDLSLCSAPLRGVALVLGLNAAFWWGLMPTPALAMTGMVSYISLGLLYEWTHFIIHTRYRPKSRLYKHLWRHHRLHHCKNERYWYGVSMTLGDYVLGTAPDQRKVQTSATCKTVHDAP